MLINRILLAVIGALILLAGCTDGQQSDVAGNIITGEGFPNPKV